MGPQAAHAAPARDMRKELEEWRQARAARSGTPTPKTVAPAKKKLQSRQGRIGKENIPIRRAPLAKAVELSCEPQTPVTPGGHKRHVNAVSPLTEICQNTQNRLDQFEAANKQICRKLENLPLESSPVGPSAPSALEIWEEQLQAPRVPPSSPQPPFDKYPLRPPGVDDFWTWPCQPAALATILSDALEGVAEQFPLGTWCAPTSPVPKKQLLHCLEEVAGEGEPQESLETDAAHRWELSSPSSAQHNLQDSEPISPLVLQPQRQPTQSQEEERQFQSPIDDVGNWYLESNMEMQLESVDTSRCSEDSDVNYADLAAQLRRHYVVWPQPVKLDMEDHLCRAFDIITFWFFEARDRINSMVPALQPSMQPMTVIHEYPPDWPPWRISSFELRKAARAARLEARHRSERHTTPSEEAEHVAFAVSG